MTRPQPQVVVAVLTYRRPQGLAAVLPALVAQLADSALSGHVLVVDNDPEGSARAAVAGLSPDVVYVHEPRPGIAAARNRAITCSAHADVLVFIDDDELPTAGWLSRLVHVWRTSGAAAVAGPVLSRFDGPVDSWIIAGEFFRRPRRATGTRLHGAATNNLLLDLARLRALGLQFDEAFGLTGGSDTMLTHALVHQGEQLLWCDEAVVEEVVPVERSTRRWVLRRQFRAGNVWSRVALALSPSRRSRGWDRAGLTVRCGFRLLAGAAGWTWGTVLRHQRHQAHGARDVASGLGALLGAYGYVYAEYRRPVVGAR